LATLLDYLPRETIILLCEPEQLALRVDEYAQQIPTEDSFFVAWENFVAELDKRGMTRVELSEDSFPLTPALSPGERENHTPSHEISSAGISGGGIEKSQNDRALSPLPPTATVRAQGGRAERCD